MKPGIRLADPVRAVVVRRDRTEESPRVKIETGVIGGLLFSGGVNLVEDAAIGEEFMLCLVPAAKDFIDRE